VIDVLTEPHPTGGHRWLLIDPDTGEILYRGQQGYSTARRAHHQGAHQRAQLTPKGDR
jgi:hypothetical protein